MRAVGKTQEIRDKGLQQKQKFENLRESVNDATHI